ncbi:MAG: citrate synthase [Clostridiales bacterium GWF2_38_85]|nr:MAG: citrate synthase [Clostridiales bacterium GWF2_38_85]HBL85100.1 citrate synthase [Clostridiales bacterium]
MPMSIHSSEHLNLKNLINDAKTTYEIPTSAFEGERIKKGLRNSDGTGVIAGVTGIGLVHGYVIDEGEKTPIDGKLYYRGYDVEKIVEYYANSPRFGYEECSYLLLMGKLPTEVELAHFDEILNFYRRLPSRFAEDVILKAPARNIMSKIAASVLALASFDDRADDCSFENVLMQSISLIARVPIIAAMAYAVKRHKFYNESLTLHFPRAGYSTSENFLRIARPDKMFTPDEAMLLDLCLILHAEHGGGNNSTFTCRVLSSTGTDSYCAIAAALGSLKGPKHGGANIKVIEMLDDLKANVRDYNDEEEIAAYLKKIINKEAYDKSGLIYGMGHAVYTKSDPRAIILKQYAQKMAKERGFDNDFKILQTIERLSPALLAARTSANAKAASQICANIDMYSGTVFRMLDIPSDMFTPLFAISRVSGWCAHRLEEIVTSKKIIRPGYKSYGDINEYIPLEERK